MKEKGGGQKRRKKLRRKAKGTPDPEKTAAPKREPEPKGVVARAGPAKAKAPAVQEEPADAMPIPPGMPNEALPNRARTATELHAPRP